MEKKERRTSFHMRIDGNILQTVKELAESENRSVANMMEVLLAAAIEEYKNQGRIVR